MATIVSRSYVLVTGGGGGIGSAVCRLLPAIGITPILGFNDNAASAQSLAEELGGLALRIDLTNDDSINEAINFIAGQMGESDVLVGVVLGASPPPDIFPFNDLCSSHFSHQIQVNVIGVHCLLKGLIKKFFRKRKSGTVIGILTNAIGSDVQLPATGMAAYVVSKVALKGLLSVCSAEYPWLKVRSVSPGFTNTKMLEVFDARYLEMLQFQNKISKPEDIAQLIIEKIKS
jgi:NAD(P)-dependent dehydrogenase (short-subunit alcohol dehydrogenase family)